MALVANTSNTNDALAAKIGNHRSNVILAYVTLQAGVSAAITPGAVTTAVAIIPVPFACTVQRIDVTCVTSAGGASRPTLNVAGTTLAANVLASSATLVTAGVVSLDSTTTPALLNPILTQGELLTVNLTTAASEVVTGFLIVITIAVSGYVQAVKTYE